jgi:hypothetical protein
MATPSISQQNARGGLTQVWFPDPGDGSPGECSTVNTTASPNDVRVSTLSDVLQAGVIPPQFYLSELAAQGMCRRILKRLKEKAAKGPWKTDPIPWAFFQELVTAATRTKNEQHHKATLAELGLTEAEFNALLASIPE